MILNRLNRLFPFQKLLKLLLILAVGIQIIVISYNHLSGFYPLDSPAHFFLRLLRGVSLGLIAGFLIAIPDLLIIRYLNKTFQWNSRVLPRVLIQLGLSILLAFIGSTLVTLFANLISKYTEELISVLVYNALIYGVVNILLMVILEGWLFFEESNKAKITAEKLERELSQIRFDVLKSQINPHFMFNSLNVLSGLIDKDVTKAQLFIEEFSHIYRYVLETIEKPVVTLEQELGFVRSYIFLQQIRYGENLTYDVNLPAAMIELFMPPLSLQVVLENSIKHNIVNESRPLHIDISSEGSWLIVKNTIQPKISKGISTGLGQKNLVKRYAMISDDTPVFMIDANYYIAKLPLINSENNGHTYN